MYMGNIKLIAKSEKEVETLIETIRIYNQDIGMKFSLEKSVTQIKKRGKWEIKEGIELLNQERIRTPGEKGTYK